jgi:Tol biopolymer transport system component
LPRVAYIDNNNVVLSSPDGSQKFQLTTNGTADAKWSNPSQGPDGKTIAVLGASGTSSKVLYLFGADGKQVTGNVMPVYSGATIPVYPIGIDMDWKSQAVA